MSLPIERQRELCAEFMGWRLAPAKTAWEERDGGYVMFCTSYLPDQNVQQAADLKAELDGCRYTFSFYHWGMAQDCECTIHSKVGADKKVILAHARGPSEEAALVEAVAEMQAKEDSQ